MSEICVAATQMHCDWDIKANVQRAEKLIRQAASQGAQVILIQELFETPYFCIEQDFKHMRLATSLDESTTIKQMSALARELEIVIPVSWFEQAGTAYFNSVAMIDADGEVMGLYRKTHIPNDVGYQEKLYFSPGDTGFKVWDTRYGKVGIAVCWDQWFPETARCMVLQGADVLLYPTAIGTEASGDHDSMEHWRLVMRGHAAANVIPVIASNRIGTETATTSDDQLTFYGSSFITNHFGELVEQANRKDETVLVHHFDLDEIRHMRDRWGLFRDRRPSQYGPILTLDGKV